MFSSKSCQAINCLKFHCKVYLYAFMYTYMLYLKKVIGQVQRSKFKDKGKKVSIVLTVCYLYLFEVKYFWSFTNLIVWKMAHRAIKINRFFKWYIVFNPTLPFPLICIINTILHIWLFIFICLFSRLMFSCGILNVGKKIE